MLLQVNVITLELNPTKTIFTECAQTSGLSPALIVSGLHGTKQTDGVGPEVTVTVGVGTSTVVNSTWSGGNITIVMSADIPASVTTQFTFQLVNSYSAQNPITDALIEVVGLGLADTNLEESADFLQIIQAEWTLKTARQSIPYRKLGSRYGLLRHALALLCLDCSWLCVFVLLANETAVSFRL